MNPAIRPPVIGLPLFVASAALAVGAPRLSHPKPSAEATALYDFLLETSGKGTLTGQHCVPLGGSTRLGAVQHLTGKYPAVFSQDFGFSQPGTWDGINFRQAIVDEAIRRHEQGFIINLMWHAVRPTDDEPVTFKESIQGKLTDEQWRQLLTPGSELHQRWQSQVDVIAFFLKQLRHAHVPVLWRPYHEMNGDWFWWGGRPGKDGYAALYRMLHDRLVRFHGLDNLIWVYGANEVHGKIGPYADYFPGHDVVDALATDVYSTAFAGPDYDDLLKLADGKPIALGEVGPLPPVELLQKQPRWAWFVAWEVPNGRDSRTLATLYHRNEVLTHDELPWVRVKQPTVHEPIFR